MEKEKLQKIKNILNRALLNKKNESQEARYVLENMPELIFELENVERDNQMLSAKINTLNDKIRSLEITTKPKTKSKK